MRKMLCTQHSHLGRWVGSLHYVIVRSRGTYTIFQSDVKYRAKSSVIRIYSVTVLYLQILTQGIPQGSFRP